MNAVVEAWKQVKAHPTEENLTILKTAMNKAGTNYTKVDGMAKDFAVQFIHAKLEPGKITDALKKYFSSQPAKPQNSTSAKKQLLPSGAEGLVGKMTEATAVA